MNFESLYANPAGRTSRGAFVPALVILILVAAFYQFVARSGRNGEWVLVTLLFPSFMLHARRLHDMGRTAWLLLVPGVAIGVEVWLHMIAISLDVQPWLDLLALIVAAAFMLWGLVGKGQAEANRFGEPVGA